MVNVGIGTSNPQYLLDVKGTLRANEIFVEPLSSFPDYVFEENYTLPPLSEVNQFINKNGHLPEIPSATEVKENGLNMTEFQLKLLQKIEELTLYTIQQQEPINKLSEKVIELENVKK